MNTIAFDTLKYAKKLQSAGVSEAQAVAEAEALQETLSAALDRTLATKEDIKDLKHELTLRFDSMIAIAVVVIAALFKWL